MLLGVLRGRLLLRLGVLVVFALISACGACGGSRPRSRFSSRSAALPRRIDSAISSSVSTSLCLADVFHRRAARRHLRRPWHRRDADATRSPSTPTERAAEPLAALMGDRHLDLHEMAGIALEIRAAHQRPVDARRGNLQPIGALDRVGDIEHRRQRARDRLAILDLHRAVRPLGHDLHGAAGLAGNPDPHQAIAHAAAAPGPATADTRAATPGSTTRRGSASSSASMEPAVRFGHIQRQGARSCMVQAWLKRQSRLRNLPDNPSGRTFRKPRSGNKKERVPWGPLSLRVSYEKLIARRYSAFPPARQGPRSRMRAFCDPAGLQEQRFLHETGLNCPIVRAA